LDQDGSVSAPAELFGCTGDEGWGYHYAVPCIDGPGAGYVSDIAFAADGHHVYTTNPFGTIASFDQDPSSGTLFPIGTCLGDDQRCASSPLIGRSGRLGVAGSGPDTFVISPGGVGSAGAADVVSVVTVGRAVTPRLSITDVKKKGRSGGKQAFVFTVTLTGMTNDDVTVDFKTINGTAKAGNDYLPVEGTLTLSATERFPQPSVKTGTITVYVKGHRTKTRTKRFTVQLSSPTGGYIARAMGAGTIVGHS
jgi:hypothetical protein